MAGSAIKGITVEIGGDTTKLGKAIGDSEKKSRSLQVELRQVEKLLKLDPTNVELLTQKQNILSNAVLETSKKLDIMKEAEAQVIAQFERGEIGEEQLRAFQRELIKTEKTLGDMKLELQTATRNLEEFADNAGVAKEAAAKLAKEIEEQNKALEAEKQALEDAEKAQKEHEKAVAKAKKELEDFKDKASDAFDKVKTGAAVLGGAVLGAAGYSLKLSNDFDKASNILIMKTGAATDEIDGLNEAMETVYANNFGESIEDVAQSMATVKVNTKLVGEELQNATERALLLRDTFDFDVNESTRTAKMLMDQYGMSSEEAFNLIAQGAQKGLDKNGDLLDTINEYSVHFNSMGLSAEEMFNMLVNGAENGTFSVDKLGDAVKEFGIRVKDGTAENAFKELGFDVDTTALKFTQGGENAKQALQDVTTALFNMEDPVKQNLLGVELFGTMWEDLGIEGIKSLMNLEGEISKTSDALNTINDQRYDDIGSALQGLGRTLETDVVKPLGEELKPVVEEAISYVREHGPEIKDILSNIVTAIGKFVGYVVEHGSQILSTIAGIGTGLLVWNVASMIKGVVNAIKAFKLANEGATIAQWLLNTAMSANPIGILIAVIAAVVVAIGTFIATNEDARAKIIEIWNKIKKVASAVFDALATFFTETIPNAIGVAIDWFKSIPQKIHDAISSAVSTVSDIFTRVKDTIFSIAQNIYDNLPNGFQLVVQNIKTIIENFVRIFQNCFSIIQTIVQTVISVIKAIFSGDFASIPGIVSEALEKIGGFFLNIFDAIITIVINWIAMIINYFRGLAESWLQIFNNLMTTLSTWWSNLQTIFVTWVQNIITSVISFFTQLPSKIYNAIVGAIERVQTWGASVRDTAKNMISNMISSVVSLATTLPNKIYSAIQGAISFVSNWGSSLISTAGNAIHNMVNNIVSIASGLPGKFLDIGRNIIEGIKSGIAGAVSGLYDSIKSALSGLVDKAKSALGIHSPSRVFASVVGKQIPAGIAVGIKDNADIANNAVEKMTNDLTEQELALSGVTVKRNLTTTFNTESDNLVTDNTSLLSKLDGIYERLSRLQIVLDTGTLVGETIDKIDAELANKQLLSARGV